MVQARVWELNQGAVEYELTEIFEPEEVDVKTEMFKAIKEVLSKGHDFVQAFRGKQSGHICKKCKRFKTKTKFAA